MLILTVIALPLAVVGQSLKSLLAGGGVFGAMGTFIIAKRINTKLSEFCQDHRHAKYKARDATEKLSGFVRGWGERFRRAT